MKASIFDYVVVRVDKSADSFYYICTTKPFSNIYKHIFTGEKIKIEDSSCVEPLRSYYSLLSIMNYETEKCIKPSRKELLDKCIEINQYHKGYQMRETYQADKLVVANLKRLSGEVTDFGPISETTQQKYIFEVVSVEDEIRYQEVFTGFIAKEKREYFELPYVVNPTPFTTYYPEAAGATLPGMSLLWTQNDINYPKDKEKVKELKKD